MGSYVCVGNALTKILKEQFPAWFPGRPMTTMELICFEFVAICFVSGLVLYMTRKRKKMHPNKYKRNRRT